MHRPFYFLPSCFQTLLHFLMEQTLSSVHQARRPSLLLKLLLLARLELDQISILYDTFLAGAENEKDINVNRVLEPRNNNKR